MVQYIEETYTHTHFMRRIRMPVLAISLLLLLFPSSLWGQTVMITVPLTRAQAVSAILLARSPRLPPYDARKQFRDLSADASFNAAMRAAEQYGIIEADSEGLLRPGEPVTRAAFLKMLARAFGLQQGLPYRYGDVPANAWYVPYAGLAERYELFPEDTDIFRLAPERTITQREASFAIAAALKHRPTTRAASSAPAVARSPTRRVPVDPRKIAQPRTSVRHVPTERPATLHEQRAELLMLLNRIRTQRGLLPLKYHTLLELSAQMYAEDMTQRKFFSHVSPEGKTLKDRVQESGYRNRTFAADCFCVKGYALAENLARGQRTPKEAIAAWMKSKPHRSAMLSSEYRDVGFGVSSGTWVQHFGAVLLPEDIAVTGAPEAVHASP